MTEKLYGGDTLEQLAQRCGDVAGVARDVLAPSGPGLRVPSATRQLLKAISDNDATEIRRLAGHVSDELGTARARLHAASVLVGKLAKELKLAKEEEIAADKAVDDAVLKKVQASFEAAPVKQRFEVTGRTATAPCNLGPTQHEIVLRAFQSGRSMSLVVSRDQYAAMHYGDEFELTLTRVRKNEGETR